MLNGYRARSPLVREVSSRDSDFHATTGVPSFTTYCLVESGEVWAKIASWPRSYSFPNTAAIGTVSSSIGSAVQKLSDSQINALRDVAPKNDMSNKGAPERLTVTHCTWRCQCTCPCT
jgi:hypothetical protein